MTDRDSTHLALALQLEECGLSSCPVMPLEAMQQVGAELNNFTKKRELEDSKYAQHLDRLLNGDGSAAGCGGSYGAVYGGSGSITTSLTQAQQMWQLHTDAELARKIAQDQADHEVALKLQAHIDGGRDGASGHGASRGGRGVRGVRGGAGGHGGADFGLEDGMTKTQFAEWFAKGGDDDFNRSRAAAVATTEEERLALYELQKMPL